MAGGRRQPGACGGDGVGGFERAAAHALASARWASPLTGGNLVVAGLLLANQFSFVGALLFYRLAKRGGEPSPSREGAKKGNPTGFRFIAYGCNRRRHPLGSCSNKKNINEVSHMPTGQHQFNSQNCCPGLYGFEADKRTKPRPNALRSMKYI